MRRGTLAGSSVLVDVVACRFELWDIIFFFSCVRMSRLFFHEQTCQRLKTKQLLSPALCDEQKCTGAQSGVDYFCITLQFLLIRVTLSVTLTNLIPLNR